MKRRLTVNTTALERGLFPNENSDKFASPRIAAIPTGEVVEFVAADYEDRVWVQWHGSVWSINRRAWETAEPM